MSEPEGGFLEQISGELESLVARVRSAVVAVEQRGGQGTGVMLTPDGYLLTNAHVVGETASPRIGFADGRRLTGEVVGRDDRSDLAVIRVDTSGSTALPLAERESLKVGRLVLAIGNPLSFDRSVSLGVISALDRNLPAERGRMLEGLIQTDAAINPGNSGGPLIDTRGRVVGINTAIIPFAQGIGFAIPAHTASWVAAVLIQKGAIRRPFLGISARGEPLEHTLARVVGQARAVRVLGVGRGTPAMRAGMERGDLLLSANGRPVASIDDLQRIIVLAEAPRVELGILRGERRQALSVVPATEPERAAA